MKDLDKFLNLTIVKSLFSLVLVSVIIGNIYYLIQIDRCSEINSVLSKDTKDLARNLDQLSNRESYQNSTLYTDKQTKLNFKMKGEDIVDMSVLEGNPSKPKSNYIPEAKTLEKSKLENWIDYLVTNKSTLLNSNYCS